MTVGGPTGSPAWDLLEPLLEESRRLGFLGPGPLAPHIAHARGFASSTERAPESFLDLGSGGGLPGLVLAREWPAARGVLLDAMERRTDFLRHACAELGIAERIDVVCTRAEVAGRDPRFRAQFDLVTARSFGPPAVTAECGVGFLRAGGRLVVSEPPEDRAGRWSVEGLELLSLVPVRAASEEHRFVVFELDGDPRERFPRRAGIPGKRPLWS